ncbi:MAG: hypothetical protein A2W18_01940 [Candidatus Muproteobacteria bacterium RBG_16_60_9]|uniref:3-oxoacyl-ACP synthase n=1 Tax=Candidatus Muproteobacteria bacterium RBG_16_60_9 TaxID=1817755 RepID=A0A1F6UXH8_9PROT|nr:MAG: hypothetical protein A2W18_01940 [Candidatus Muproteobacteria bacterium RBG_16_60_9]
MYTYTKGHSRIAGTGIYLPDERVTTRELMSEIGSKERFGISYDWLERVTGIKEKRVTPSGILPSDMAVAAAKEALENARLTARQIDAIIYTGLTRDHLEPATAHIVQSKLGADNATVFDISNACHGFMNGIHVMDALIATKQVRYGAIVTGEQGSVLTRRTIDLLKTLNGRDRFLSTVAGLTVGDAGAAFLMGPRLDPEAGVIGLMLQSQGKHFGLCTVGTPEEENSGSTNMTALLAEAAQLIQTMFNEFMHNRLKWQIQDLAKCLIHQVGSGAFQIHKKLGIPPDIIPNTMDMLGNLITANIPLSLHYCRRNNELAPGSKIFVSGQGSGISLSQAGLVWDIA